MPNFVNIDPANQIHTFSAPLSDPRVEDHFRKHGMGAYSFNPGLRRFGSTLGNFVSGQPMSFTDETGTVNIDPANQGLSVKPRQGFGLAVKGRDMVRGGTPSAEVTFQFGGSGQTPSSASNVQDSRPARSAGREFVDKYIDANKIREAARYYY
jgi:hypothetical protein